MDEVLLQIKLKNIEKKLDRIATLLEEMPLVMAATMLLMKQEVDEASMQGKKASDLYEERVAGYAEGVADMKEEMERRMAQASAEEA